MKSGLRWTVGAVIAAAAFTVLLIPRGEPQGRWRSFRSARFDSLYTIWNTERLRLSVLTTVVNRGIAREEAQRLSGADRAPLTWTVDPALPAVTRERFARRVNEELRALGVDQPRHRVVIIARVDTSLRGAIYTRAIVLPETADAPCTVVLRLPFSHRDRTYPSDTQRLLGTCGFFAGFGTPGAETARWLTETRGGAARFTHVPPAYLTDTARFALSVAALGIEPPTQALLRCRTGDLEACARFVEPFPTQRDYAVSRYFREDLVDREPLRTEFPGVEVQYSTSWSGEVGRLRDGTLAALLLELGPDRFGTLWRDARGIGGAYTAVAGRPFAVWIAEYVGRRTGPYVSGPSVSLLSTILAAVLILVSAVFTVRLTKRELT